jgi:hypothetical protein
MILVVKSVGNESSGRLRKNVNDIEVGWEDGE